MSMTLLLSWFFSSRSFSLLHFCHTGSFGVIGFFSPKKWNHHLKIFIFFNLHLHISVTNMQKMWMGMNAFHSTACCCFSTVDSLNSKYQQPAYAVNCFILDLLSLWSKMMMFFFPQMTVSKMDLDSTETHKVNTQPWWSYRNCMTY